ncbi:MAG: hypothetical protein JXO44_13820 [Clostridia bacterium]|nr:hypothetical protein [Clostridia bacterium]
MKVDLAKIFLTPPKSLFERVVLFLMLVVSFILFFRPLQFSAMPPFEAVLTALVPSLSISWGWLIFLRYRFRKKEFLTRQF